MTDAPGPFSGLRVLELADEKGQFCGKLLGDLGADVVKIEPPGRRTLPPRRAVPGRHPAPGPQPVVLVLQHVQTRHHARSGNRRWAQLCFARLAATADVILETFRPGLPRVTGSRLRLFQRQNAGLIMCSLTPFGQTGPWRDFVSSDLLHMAAGGEMASCGYDEADVPNAPPIAPGGGNAWHMGCHLRLPWRSWLPWSIEPFPDAGNLSTHRSTRPVP